MESQVSSDNGSKTKTRLNTFWRVVFFISTIAGITLAILQLFLIAPVMETSYMYWLMALFMSFVFIIYPATSKSSKEKPPFYDIVLFVMSVSIASYFAINGFTMVNTGWAFMAPQIPTILSAVFWCLVLEAVRRAGGTTLFVFTAIFSLFPLFCHVMPGILQGANMEFWQVSRYHIFSTESVIGIPMYVLAYTIVGFILFGSVLVSTGGGKFFLDFASSLLGTQPGGPAKVAVLSSGFFGSLSGSVISNIVTTGSMTIPTMKRVGYPNYYAAAVESCASTGGTIMPPVMGAVAFVMASLLNVAYIDVAIAAFFPALLYFFALYMQIELYARKANLSGMDKSEIPKLLPVLKNGLIFLIPVAVLIFVLFLRRESQSPFFASLALIALVMLKSNTRMSLNDLFKLIVDAGKLLANLVAILAACGFIIGAFSLTGVGSSLSRELVQLADGNALLMLIFGAIGSFVLGMGMTITACYIFLAIILIPALVAAHPFDLMAAHLFVLYFGVISYITPPVALGSYTAAGIAGAQPLRTGFTSMRLGIVTYIVPFFFIYRPALIFHDTLINIIYYCGMAVVGIMLLTGGLEGYFFKLGKLSIISRIAFIIVGFLLAVPNTISSVIAGVISVLFLTLYFINEKFFVTTVHVGANE